MKNLYIKKVVKQTFIAQNKQEQLLQPVKCFPLVFFNACVF